MGGREIPFGDEEPDYILIEDEDDDEIFTDPDIEYADDDPFTPWDDPTEEIAQLTAELRLAVAQRDELGERIDSYRELMQEMADRFIDELTKRKSLELQLESAYAHLMGIRCAVRDEHGDVHLVKLPVTLPEGSTFE